MHDAIVSPGPHSAGHLHFALIYFLNSQASRDPPLCICLFSSKCFFFFPAIAQEPHRKLKCSQNVMDKYESNVRRIL